MMDITHKHIQQANMELQSHMTSDGVELGSHDNVPRIISGTRFLIVDLSCVPHVDCAGINTIWGIYQEIDLLGVQLILSGPNDNVFGVFKHAKDELHIGIDNLWVVPSNHDAVLLAQSML